MARRVFLHIGLPKTGTTYLQTMMWHNRALLRERGFLYPGRQRMDHYRGWQAVKRGAQDERAATTWESLLREIRAWDGDALVSHEFFSMATPRQAARAVEQLGPAEVHLVLTARAYALQLPAVWQEALKMGSTRTFGDFVDEMLQEGPRGGDRGAWGWRSQDLRRVLRRWGKAVPLARTTVVTVPPPGGPRTLLWQRWCEAVGIDDRGFDLDAPFANESLGAEQTALLLRVNPHLSGPLLDGGERHRWVRHYLGHQVLVPQNGARFAVREADRARVQQLSEAAVATLARRGCRVVGDPADLLAASPATAHPDEVSDAEILGVAEVAIEQMVRDVRELSLERDELRRRLRTGRGSTRRRARGFLRRGLRRVQGRALRSRRGGTR